MQSKKKKIPILAGIFIAIIAIAIYRTYAFSATKEIRDDFISVIHGHAVENEVNGERLQRYYPKERFVYTHVSCENVVILGNTGRMYMKVYGTDIINKDSIITTNDYYDALSIDIEKVSGKWQIKKVNFQP